MRYPGFPAAEVLQRAVWIRCGGSQGTAFTIEVEDRQFLVTAAHVVKDRSFRPIEVAVNNHWETVTFRAIPADPPDLDVLVLAPPNQLTPALEVVNATDGIVVGQQVFVLGFPYDPADLMHAGTPLLLASGGLVPFVKSATIAAFLKAPGPSHLTLLLDTYVNEGFSGGPVVGPIPGQAGSRIFGVVSHYVPEGEAPPGFSGPLSGNRHPGLVIAYDIGHAIEGIFAAGPSLGAKVLRTV